MFQNEILYTKNNDITKLAIKVPVHFHHVVMFTVTNICFSIQKGLATQNQFSSTCFL